jgi:hypothetical protein
MKLDSGPKSGFISEGVMPWILVNDDLNYKGTICKGLNWNLDSLMDFWK